MAALQLVIIGSDERRAEVAQLVREHDEVSIAGEVSNAHTLRLVPHLAPDVVVLDCAMPSLNALTALPWLHLQPEAPRIIALGASGGAAERRLLLELGAVAYVEPHDRDALRKALGLASRLTALTGGPRQPALGLSWSA